MKDEITALARELFSMAATDSDCNINVMCDSYHESRYRELALKCFEAAQAFFEVEKELEEE